MFNPDDLVEVLNSKRGYKGPGTVVGPAYGNHYLVKVQIQDKTTVITVRFQDLRKSHAQTLTKSKTK